MDGFHSSFYCPITFELMVDPFIDREGNTFERAAIVEWLYRYGISPITRTPMRVEDLVPNRILRELIEEARNFQLKDADRPIVLNRSSSNLAPMPSPLSPFLRMNSSLSSSSLLNILPILQDNPTSAWTLLNGFKAMEESLGWSVEQYFSTIATAVIGRKIIVFGRFRHSLQLFSYDTVSLTWTALPTFERMSDASGWYHPQYFETIRMVTIGSKLYIFGRGAAYLHMFSFDMLSESWAQHPGMREMADNQGWSAPRYRKTIRVVPIGTKIFIFGRGSQSLHLISFDTEQNTWTTLPGLEQMSDADGWLQPEYYETLRVVAAGMKLVVFGRGAFCVQLLVFDTVLSAWTAPSALLEEFTDAQGWGERKYYSTIRLILIGSRLLLLGRGRVGVCLYCFHLPSCEWTILPVLPQMTDELGWAHPKQYETLRVTTAGAKLYLSGRGRDGLQLFSFSFMDNSWEEHARVRKLTDAEDWDREALYRTISVEVVQSKIYVFGRGKEQLTLFCFDPSFPHDDRQD